MKRALLLVLPFLLACVTGTSSGEEGATIIIRNRNFYAATVTFYCDGFEMPPRLRAYAEYTRGTVNVSRCAALGWVASLLASGDAWGVDGVQVSPGDILEISLAPTLRHSTFRFR